MTKQDLLKDNHFEEVSEARMDSKNRITLARTGAVKVFSFRVYKNSLGQYILDPQATVPAHEAWLFKNQEAKEAVQKGLKDAKNKRLVKGDEDYAQYLKESA